MSEALTPGFMVVHGNRLEELRGLAVGWMRRYPLAPLENEQVLVQSNGIAQWLKLALAEDPRGDDEGGCGGAAALEVQLPAAFLWRTYRQVLGRDNVPPSSPLDRAPLTWRLMRLLPTLLMQPDFAALRRFLDDDGDLRKRYQLAERLADLYDGYQVYRADWLNDWAAGRDLLASLRDSRRPLPESCRWQAQLWRALLADVGDGGLARSRAGVHRRFLEVMQAATEAPAGLPRRVVIFGLSAIPAQTLEALAALARFSQVLLCVHNPCRHHWSDIVADQDLLRQNYRRQQRKPGMPQTLDAEALHQHGQPLLASWGKQGRDYIHLLDEFDEPDGYRRLFEDLNGGRIDLFAETEPQHLLGQLQDDILELRPLAETRERWSAVDPARDRSVRFHLAHSPQREVEILHDQLLARFSSDGSLRPRDVIVMVPDVDAYAPHIRAVFGQLDRSDPRFIPFSLADQHQRGFQPLLIALEHLLQLPDSRFALSEILDLLDVPALRARFGLREGDLPTLHLWLEGAGVRWGLDAEQRSRLDLPEGLTQNTWRFGLRRMLLGYAVGGGAALGDIEPFDEVGGLDAALVGPLVDLLDALDAAQAALAQPARPAEWGARLQALLALFFSAQDEHDEYLLEQLENLRERWLELCEDVALDEELPLTVVREAWLAGLDAGGLAQRFLAGAVNFCTLMPMRAIPFRVVCLLGMHDGAYPRIHPPLDFDLMAQDYRPGDRSRREDDRYLLLEALLSARDQFYVSWVGRSIRDNSERPPSVLIAQLRDHLQAGWRLAGHEEEPERLLAALTQEHPLQPFSARYFRGERGYFSFAAEWLGVHDRTSRDEDTLLPPLVLEEPLGLDDLARFLRGPVDLFFANRLKVHFEAPDAPAEDEEPFGLDALTRYQLGEGLLEAALAEPEAVDRALTAAAERLRGSGRLPLAGFGERAGRALREPLPVVVAQVEALTLRWPEPLEEAVTLNLEHREVQLVANLERLRRGPEGLLALTAQANGLGNARTRKWHRLLRPWVQHLVAAAGGLQLTTAVVATDLTLLLPPLDTELAQRQLHELLDAWALGQRRPLPVAPRTAFAWLANEPDKALAFAEQAYQGEAATHPALRRQYPDFAALLADEEFDGWCQTLYAPVFTAGWQVVGGEGQA
jgi:exodeoxyribonuclease V gamma subunit